MSEHEMSEQKQEQAPADLGGNLSRRQFVAEQRRVNENYFRRTASIHDEGYGEFAATHLECVHELLAAIEPGQELLDAACGTGKYFSIFTASGRSVFGIDQSAEMLELARTKWPDVPTQQIALQDLRNALNLHGRFSGLVCIDAMEWVLHDDWSSVLKGFRTVLKPGSPVYINVELTGHHKRVIRARDVDLVMPGEIFVGRCYNCLPNRQTVLGWLSEAGFRISSERTGDYYWHLLMQAP